MLKKNYMNVTPQVQHNKNVFITIFKNTISLGLLLFWMLLFQKLPVSGPLALTFAIVTCAHKCKSCYALVNHPESTSARSIHNGFVESSFNVYQWEANVDFYVETHLSAVLICLSGKLAETLGY